MYLSIHLYICLPVYEGVKVVHPQMHSKNNKMRVSYTTRPNPPTPNHSCRMYIRDPGNLSRARTVRG